MSQNNDTSIEKVVKEEEEDTSDHDQLEKDRQYHKNLIKLRDHSIE